ncbi:hypothetical protein DY000_02004036 [Brassica cretica]|uniref:Uncharacterized protein n=1 Tax=Brassica cretica TaxID=69181 RepID=A0ABQ7C8B6_BRACR|nr:hypothetical protein DY000_02004036 [Brassica cretica]
MAPPPIRTVAIYNTHEVHSIDFFGNEVTVTVTADASVICEWISNVHTYDCAPLTYSHHPLVVGVGVQWTPRRVDSSADTLQLGVGNECLVIQLSHCDHVPDELRIFLLDPDTIFIGVLNSQDARKLATSRHELQIGELLDLRNYAQDCRGRSMRRCSFEEIVDVCMRCPGVRLDPEISMSDKS